MLHHQLPSNYFENGDLARLIFINHHSTMRKEPCLLVLETRISETSIDLMEAETDRLKTPRLAILYAQEFTIFMQAETCDFDE